MCRAGNPSVSSSSVLAAMPLLTICPSSPTKTSPGTVRHVSGRSSLSRKSTKAISPSPWSRKSTSGRVIVSFG